MHDSYLEFYSFVYRIGALQASVELRENLAWIIIRTFFSGQRIGMYLSTDLLNSTDMHGIFIKNSHG